MGVHLSDQELALVQQRTENWLAGLQLVGLSLKGSSAPTRNLLSEVSGHHEFILDYLTDEVLNKQPPAIQALLLSTSILEQLSAPLCDALLEQQGSQQVLEQLERSNLFIVSLDSRRRWYSYHSLFAQALRYRLEQWQGERVTTLHQRASCWYAAHGFTSEAVGHALLSQDWGQAAILIEHSVSPMLWQRSNFSLVQRWLKQLPPTVIRSHPRLSFAYAWVLYYVSSAGDAITWLEAAEEGLAQRQTAGVALPAEEQAALDNLRGELFVLRARIGLPDGDGQKIRKLCQHALSQLSPANRLARSEALLLQCSADAFLGDLEPATRSALEGAELAQEGGGSLPQTLVYLAYAILVLHQRGQFHEALRIAQRAEQVGRMPDGLHLPMMSVVLLYQSWILLEWNRLEEALDLARRALELKEHTGLILKQSRLYIGEPARGSPSVGTPPRLYSTLSRPGTGLKRLT